MWYVAIGLSLHIDKIHAGTLTYWYYFWITMKHINHFRNVDIYLAICIKSSDFVALLYAFPLKCVWVRGFQSKREITWNNALHVRVTSILSFVYYSGKH